MFTVLLSRPTLLTSLPVRLSSSLLLSLSVALQRVVVQRRPYWRSDLEGIKNLPRDASRLEALFPLLVSTVRSLSSEPDFPPLLQSVTSSSPLLIASALSHSFFFFLSLSLLRHRRSFLLLPDVLRLSAGSSAFECAFLLLSLVVSILPAVHLPRSYGSFVSLVISSYGHGCVSLWLWSRVLFAHRSISSARILWKVSVLFVLALWAVSLCLCLSLTSLDWLLSSSHARDIGPDTGGTRLHVREGPGVSRVISISPQ